MRFSNQVEVYSDESFEGFLHRVAIINHRTINDLNLKYIRDYTQERDLLYNLEQVNALTGLNKSLDEVYPYVWYLQGLTLPEWKTKQYTRYCSQCLQTTSVYHRSEWCLTHHTFCYKHRVFLLENCPRCFEKIKVIDTVKGHCSQCSYSLKDCNMVEMDMTQLGELYLQETGEFCGVDSPYLSLHLSRTEQLILTQWLAYYLVEKTNLYELNFGITEKKRLAFNGYCRDTKLQFEVMTNARQLLTGWPTKLILFLKEQFLDNNDKIQAFFFNFVYHNRNENIKRVLWNSYCKEIGFKRYTNFESEQIQWDLNYIGLDDLKLKCDVYHESFCTLLHDLKVEIIKHPRYERKILHKDYIPEVLHRIKNLKQKPRYYTLKELAVLLDRNESTLEVICEYLKVSVREIVDVDCYHLESLKEHSENFNIYISLHDISEQSVWDLYTLNHFLKKNNLKEVYSSRVGSMKKLYFKTEVMSVIQNLSNNFEDYILRRDAMKLLGDELFRKAELDAYYPRVSPNGRTFFLKSSVKEILKLK
jgi:hypothetical protein